MLKIIQRRLQTFLERELPDTQAGFRKGRGTRDQIANLRWIIEKAREHQKNFYLCFLDYSKAFDCVDHTKLWSVLTKMGIPTHLIVLIKNLYSNPQATVKTEYGNTNWFNIVNGVGPLTSYVEKYITTVISNLLIQMKIAPYSHITIDFDENYQYQVHVQQLQLKTETQK
ncbi:unnamed protein product [Rotaria magnacalcarata]|nr:unnamed protein product [Rotaria magnacalcarata]